MSIWGNRGYYLDDLSAAQDGSGRRTQDEWHFRNVWQASKGGGEEEMSKRKASSSSGTHTDIGVSTLQATGVCDGLTRHAGSLSLSPQWAISGLSTGSFSPILYMIFQKLRSNPYTASVITALTWVPAAIFFVDHGYSYATISGRSMQVGLHIYLGNSMLAAAYSPV